MRTRLLALAALAGLVAAPGLVRAADDAGTKPTVEVRLESIDDLMADFKYLGGLAGKENEAQAVEGTVQAMLNAKVRGLDTKRPIYFYGSVSPNGFGGSGVALVPVTSEKDILGSLGQFNIRADKGDDGVYTVQTGNPVAGDVYFRFVHKYAYVTARDKSALDKDKLPEPASILAERKGGLATLVVRLDQLPDAAKQIAQGQLEMKLAEAKDKREPGATDAEHALKGQALDQFAKKATDLINGGGELTVHVNVDRKAGKLAAELSLAGKPGSTLAADIAEMGKAKSMFASALSGGDAAVNLLLHGAVSAEVRKVLGPAIDEGIRKNLEKETDPAKRDLGAKLLNAVAPTLKAGELDVVFRLLGPDKDEHYTIVAAAKVKDGRRIDRAVRDVLKSLPENERSKVALDAESAGGVKVHRIDAQKDYDAKAKKAFGDSPFYLAIRDNAVVVGGGPGGLSALKAMLDAEPGQAPPFVLDLSMARIAVASAHDSGNEDKVKAVKEAVEGMSRGGDQVRVTVEGGKALTIKATATADAIRLMALLGDNDGGHKRPPARVKPKKDDD